MPPPDQRADRFTYAGYTMDPVRGEVHCAYTSGRRSFTEHYRFGPDGDWSDPAVEAAVRILFLLAGVSYYKTAAAPIVDLGRTTSTVEERSFLRQYYVEGLGEFAYRNGIDLGPLLVVGPDTEMTAAAAYHPLGQRPLILFGGGIDSIVTVSALTGSDSALCIVHPPNQRFTAIEDAAVVTGRPIIRVERAIDPSVKRSDELGWLNGHVPITAIITAAALVAAVLDRRDAVVLSNEWSASVPTLVHDGHPINHQWSKGAEFEEAFARQVSVALGPTISVFSYLRSRSELWVAQQFSQLTDFHRVFRSCNRAFHQDRSDRLSEWCGMCDKCCFIDLVLSPFMSVDELSTVFGGREPLENTKLEDRFTPLLGLAPEAKPFECVGDVHECRAALVLASARPDRRHNQLVRSLRAMVPATDDNTTDLLVPMGTHFIPDRYAPADLLVRAH